MGVFSKLGDLLQGSGFSKDLTGALKAEKEQEIHQAIEALSQSGLDHNHPDAAIESLYQLNALDVNMRQEDPKE